MRRTCWELRPSLHQCWSALHCPSLRAYAFSGFCLTSYVSPEGLRSCFSCSSYQFLKVSPQSVALSVGFVPFFAVPFIVFMAPSQFVLTVHQICSSCAISLNHSSLATCRSSAMYMMTPLLFCWPWIVDYPCRPYSVCVSKFVLLLFLGNVSVIAMMSGCSSFTFHFSISLFPSTSRQLYTGS